jgi:hypothetical protein
LSKIGENINIICLESEALKSLVKQLAIELKDDPADDWINEKEAMGILDIASKTTFQKYRDTGEIIYSVVTGKKYLYKKSSIVAFIEKRSNQ